MRIKTIENIIDSVDPYFILKDLGFAISKDTVDQAANSSRTHQVSEEAEDSFILKDSTLEELPVESPGSMERYYSRINGSLLRILPFGYLNINALKQLEESSGVSEEQLRNNLFIAGTSIDMLAHYMHGDYAKAFRIFFKYYGVQLKTKLLHEPAYIEKALRHILVKRRNVLNLVVASLFSNPADPSIFVETQKWMRRGNIRSLKGIGFAMDSVHLFYMLKFISDNNILSYAPEVVSIEQGDLKIKNDNNSFASFINGKLFNDSKEWIVIPYFADYHIINSLKFINPKTNNCYQVYLNNYKNSFAGIYALSPHIDFNNTKIRVIENIYEAIVLHNYAKECLELEDQNYLAVDINLNEPNNLRSNLGTFRKLIFLNDHNSSLQTIKSLHDFLVLKDCSEADLYVCNYHAYKEDDYLYTFNAFVENKYKALITEASKTTSTGVSSELQYLMDIFDVNQLPFKRRLMDWAKSNNYIGALNKISAMSRDMVEFNNFIIWETSDGYILEPKDDPSNTQILSNFTIKVDQNIIFKDSEEIIHKGRLIMGGSQEYAIAFSKKDLLKKSAIEDLALKAYTRFTVTNLIEDDENIKLSLPTLFDGSDNPFYKNLLSVIRHNINKAPCKYGTLSLGWDKSNGVYTAMAWQATALKFNLKSQNIFAFLSYNNTDAINCMSKDLKLCFSSDIPVRMSYKKYSKFLNSGVRDVISYIISVLYRQYLGYETKPLLIHDSVNARNLVKFVFLALGQIAPFNIPNNDRFIRSKKLFDGLNDYPVYVRCKNLKLMLNNYSNNPYVVFVTQDNVTEENEKDIYSVNYGLSAQAYKQVTKFTLDTISRFFKWLFSVNIEEFALDDQIAENGTQLIYEGNLIFSYLWWDNVIVACKSEINPTSALRDLLMSMTLQQVNRHLSFDPTGDGGNGQYIFRKTMLPENIMSKVYTLTYCCKKHKLGHVRRNSSGEAERSTIYYALNRDFVEDVLQDVMTKDGYPIKPEELKIFVDAGVVLQMTSWNQPARTVDRELFEQSQQIVKK